MCLDRVTGDRLYDRASAHTQKEVTRHNSLDCFIYSLVVGDAHHFVSVETSLDSYALFCP